MPSSTPVLGPLSSQHAPLQGITLSRKALECLKNEVKSLLINRYRLSHGGKQQPSKPSDNCQPGHRQSVPMLCLGFGRDRRNAGRWYQVCKMCKKLDFMPAEIDIPADHVQHLLDMAEEISANQFFREVEESTSTRGRSTPKKRRRTEESTSINSPPNVAPPTKRARVEQALVSDENVNQSFFDDPPLTAHQLESGDLLDMTLPVPIRILFSNQSQIHQDIVYPRRDGLYVRFDDWKLLLGTFGLEIGSSFEVVNHQTRQLEHSEWSKRHVVAPGTHGFSIFVPTTW